MSSNWYKNVFVAAQPSCSPFEIPTLDESAGRHPCLSVLSLHHHEATSQLALHQLRFKINHLFVCADGDEQKCSYGLEESLIQYLGLPSSLGVKKLESLPSVNLLLARLPSNSLDQEVNFHALANQDPGDQDAFLRFLDFFR